jgi:predicted metal-dependent HD superfamily phosphohydrolase
MDAEETSRPIPGIPNWNGPKSVTIVTSDAGPAGDDVLWVVEQADGLWKIPNSAMSQATIQELIRICHGFSSKTMIRAMGCSENRIFSVWSADRSPRLVRDSQMHGRLCGLLERLGASPHGSKEVADSVVMSWNEKFRVYHDMRHLQDCLFELDDVAGVEDPGLRDRVELALWYHDVIYLPRRQDNELVSSQRLVKDCRALGVPEETVIDSAHLVLATAHFGSPSPVRSRQEADLIADIDLSILGQHLMRFMDYEFSVGEEYRSVPAPLYFWKRRAFLRGILARPSIFRTTRFQDRYEAPAHDNIAYLLAHDRYRPWGWFL